jgi:Trypsin-co-occurring domain 1
MGQLISVELEDGTIIQIEATETSSSLRIGQPQPSDPNNPKRGIFPPEPTQQITQNFQAIESTVRAYTAYTLRAFKNLAIAEVSEVELKFGVSIDARSGIPYIADGKAGCNLNIMVKCVFPKKAQE